MNIIQKGDIVSVNFNGAQYTLASKAKVLAIPRGSGDSWRLQDLDTGALHYVSEGCTITLVESKDDGQ